MLGFALKYFNAGRTEGMPYDYTRPMLIFVACGVLAMLLGLWLKAEDRKNTGWNCPISRSSPSYTRINEERPGCATHCRALFQVFAVYFRATRP